MDTDAKTWNGMQNWKGVLMYLQSIAVELFHLTEKWTWWMTSSIHSWPCGGRRQNGASVGMYAKNKFTTAIKLQNSAKSPYTRNLSKGVHFLDLTSFVYAYTIPISSPLWSSRGNPLSKENISRYIPVHETDTIVRTMPLSRRCWCTFSLPQLTYHDHHSWLSYWLPVQASTCILECTRRHQQVGPKVLSAQTTWAGSSTHLWVHCPHTCTKVSKNAQISSYRFRDSFTARMSSFFTSPGGRFNFWHSFIHTVPHFSSISSTELARKPIHQPSIITTSCNPWTSVPVPSIGRRSPSPLWRLLSKRGSSTRSPRLSFPSILTANWTSCVPGRPRPHHRAFSGYKDARCRRPEWGR